MCNRASETGSMTRRKSQHKQRADTVWAGERLTPPPPLNAIVLLLLANPTQIIVPLIAAKITLKLLSVDRKFLPDS